MFDTTTIARRNSHPGESKICIGISLEKYCQCKINERCVEVDANMDKIVVSTRQNVKSDDIDMSSASISNQNCLFNFICHITKQSSDNNKTVKHKDCNRNQSDQRNNADRTIINSGKFLLRQIETVFLLSSRLASLSCFLAFSSCLFFVLLEAFLTYLDDRSMELGILRNTSMTTVVRIVAFVFLLRP